MTQTSEVEYFQQFSGESRLSDEARFLLKEASAKRILGANLRSLSSEQQAILEMLEAKRFIGGRADYAALIEGKGTVWTWAYYFTPLGHEELAND